MNFLDPRLPPDFWDKLQPCPMTGCWIATVKPSSSVGHTKIGGDWTHRITYRLFVGSIPEGLHLDHLCNTPACCNPDHLEPVTAAENQRRRGLRTVLCPNGHVFSGDNVKIVTRANGDTERWCRDDDAEIAPVTGKQRDARRERARKQYEARKLAEQCVKCGSPAAADSLWCEKHGPAVLEAARVNAKRRRARRRAARECVTCGRPRDGQKTVVPTLPISHGVVHAQSKAARIAAATTTSFESATAASRAGTRTRFHGRARKGPPTSAETDAWDLRTLRAELELAAGAVDASHLPEVKALPRIQRDAVVNEALSHLGLLERQLDELVNRLKRRLR